MEDLLGLMRTKNVYTSRLRLACEGLDNFPLNIFDQHNPLTVYDIYNTLKGYFTGEDEDRKAQAITFIHQVLLILGDKTGLNGLANPNADYNVQTRYPEVDLRLTALKLTKNLSRREKSLLKAFLRREKAVPDHVMGNVVSLTSALFSEEGVVTVIGDLHRIAGCFDRTSITSDFLHTHGMQSGVEDSRATLDVKNLRGNVAKLRKAEKTNRRIITCIFSLIISILVVSWLILSVYVVYKISARLLTDGITASGHFNITDDSVVSLDPNGFSGNLNTIELTLQTDSDEIELKVYEQTKDDGIISTKNLSSKTINPLYTGSYFKHQPFNYNGGDKPIYGIKGSLLYFHSLINSSSNNSGYPRISIFTDRDLYWDATNGANREKNLTGIDGIVATSPRLNVSTSGPPAASFWPYTFNKTGYVYAMIDNGRQMTINGNISGSMKVYNPDNLNPICSHLTTDSKTCHVTVCGKLCLEKKATQYIFIKSIGNSNGEVKYTLYKLNLFSIELILLVIDFFIFLCIIFTCVFTCLHCGCACTIGPQLLQERSARRRQSGITFEYSLVNNDEEDFVSVEINRSGVL